MSKENKKWDFFISYSRQDTPIAKRLYRALESYGRPFLDTMCLQLGDSWDIEIQESIRKSRVIVVIITEHTNRTHFLREEIASAISMARKDPEGFYLVPLFVGMEARDRKKIPYGLLQYHGLYTDETDLEGVAKRLAESADYLKDRDNRLSKIKKEHTPRERYLKNKKYLKSKKPVNIFCSYSHRDEDLVRELQVRLKGLERQGLVETWHDRKIGAGADWKGEIDASLNEANIVLLLISPDYLASEYCWDVEMKKALERHKQGLSLVIPVMLRSCDWADAPFSELNVLPQDGKPVAVWLNRDEAWSDVVQKINKIVRRNKY